MFFYTIGYDFHHDRKFKLDRPNGLNEYLLLIIRSTAQFVINHETLQLHPDSMIILNKGTPHCIEANDCQYINDWVAFRYDRAQDCFLCDNLILDQFAVSPRLAGECADIIKLMQDEKLFGGANHQMVLELLFQALLLKFQRAFGHDVRAPHYNALAEIRRLIYNTPSERYSIEALSHMAYMSKSYFQHLYQTYFHTTPLADMIRSRMIYAKQLLSATNKTVKEISELLNYSSDIQFAKQFKQMTGKKPGQYRRLCECGVHADDDGFANNDHANR